MSRPLKYSDFGKPDAAPDDLFDRLGRTDDGKALVDYLHTRFIMRPGPRDASESALRQHVAEQTVAHDLITRLTKGRQDGRRNDDGR